MDSRGDRGYGAGQPPSIFAWSGRDLGAMAERLDDIAVSAATLSGAELRELARELPVGVLGAAGQTAPLRVALTAATPSRLADQARYAAWLLRTGGTTSTTAEPGTYVSVGAGGAVVVLFPGRAESPASQPTRLAVSLKALRTRGVPAGTRKTMTWNGAVRSVRDGLTGRSSTVRSGRRKPIN